MDAMGNSGGYVIPIYKDRGGPSCSSIAAGLWVARWQHHVQPPFFWSKEGTMGEEENQLQHMSYGRNLVHGERTSQNRVGPYRFCSGGTPPHLSSKSFFGFLRVYMDVYLLLI